MKKVWTVTILVPVLIVLLFGFPLKALAQIRTFDSKKFELARSKNSQNISWSDSFQQDENGIILQKNIKDYLSTDYWLQSEPFSIGEAWQPPIAARIIIEFNGDVPKGFWKNTDVYIRYSADKMHWSSWSNRNRIDAGSKDYDSLRRFYVYDVKQDASLYDVSISMPSVARTEYLELRKIWMKSKEYVDNEYLFFVWLAQNYPSYFEREIPVIGYVQFRVEGNSDGFDSEVKLHSISFNYGYSISGLGYFDPRDKDDANPGKKVEGKPEIKDSEGAWHFDLSKYKTYFKD